MSKTLWGGRFTKRTDPLIARYTSSINWDAHLWHSDLLGSIAHARMLGRSRIISPAESRRLVRGLTRLLTAIRRGRVKANPDAEDVHTQMEQELERLVGPVARKLHSGRSRNDQVATDLRHTYRDAARDLGAAIARLQRRLVRMAAAHQRVVIPGYTHLQRAQPILLAHQLLAYVEMLQRDVERLAEARTRMNVLPLGAGALAGSSLPLDRAYVAKQLGFARVAANSVDAVSDRDFALELAFAIACLGVHLSRMAEDLILWTSGEFGLLELDDSVATGSSLMPQKKNPDVLELIRGHAGVAIGDLTALLSIMKGLPLSYNRDLQWGTSLLCRAVTGSLDAVAALERLLARSRVRAERARALVSDEMLCATDLAEYLVERGVPFREAHTLIGKLVVQALASGRRLSSLSGQELRRVSPHLTPAVMRRLLDPARSVMRKRTAGGTGPRQVAQAIARWRRRLG